MFWDGLSMVLLLLENICLNLCVCQKFCGKFSSRANAQYCIKFYIVFYRDITCYVLTFGGYRSAGGIIRANNSLTISLKLMYFIYVDDHLWCPIQNNITFFSKMFTK